MILRLCLVITSLATALWVAGCSRATMPVADVFPQAGEPAVAGARADLIVETRRQLGTPYRYGGANRNGFDCSGLVQYVHRRIGINTPRTTTAQRKSAQRISVQALQTGDLLFFSLYRGKGRHVAIYEGDGMFIHAPSRGKRVSRASLDNPYWRNRLVGAGSYF